MKSFKDEGSEIFIDDDAVIKFVGILPLKEIHEAFPGCYPFLDQSVANDWENAKIADMIATRSNFDLRKGIFTIPIPE